MHVSLQFPIIVLFGLIYFVEAVILKFNLSQCMHVCSHFLCSSPFVMLAPLNSKESAVEKCDDKSVLKKAHPPLEDGCAVELGNPPDKQYGVIRWIRYIDDVNQAYVEMVNLNMYNTLFSMY